MKPWRPKKTWRNPYKVKKVINYSQDIIQMRNKISMPRCYALYMEQAYEVGADAILKEVVGWLKAHHRGSHRGFGHYGIYDSEIKDLLGVKE